MRWLLVLLLFAMSGTLSNGGGGCPLTPVQYDADGAPGWVSGPVTMRQGLGWAAGKPFKVVWMVPDRWSDGVTVTFAHGDGLAADIQLELSQVKRHGTGISFGTSDLVLSAPGCWRISVVHGDERYDFFVWVVEAGQCPTTYAETIPLADGETTLWTSGKVSMHSDQRRFQYILWMVPDDWRDGIHVDVRPYGADEPTYAWHLKQVVRHGWRSYGTFGYNTAEAQQADYRGLPEAGCWQFTVRHGDETGGVFIVDVK